MPEIVVKSNSQKTAEAVVDGFRKDLGPFVVAAESTRIAMLFTDAKAPDNPIIFANDSFLALTGYSREEVLGQKFNFMAERGADPASQARIDAAFTENVVGGSEISYRRKDGAKFSSAIMISPVHNDFGEIVQHFASFVDLTDHKKEQAQSRMLMDELNHRVKNTLATVQSIVWQALRSSADPGIVRESIEARLFALSRSHDLLTQEHWEGAGLLDLVKAALEPFGFANGRSDHFVIEGENLRVSTKVALSIGIGFHELATNAVKYGAFSNDVGTVFISWAIAPSLGGDRLLLRWEEKGGPPVTPPTHFGFGSRVIGAGLAHELEGEVDLDFRPEGVICTMNFPAPNGDVDV